MTSGSSEARVAPALLVEHLADGACFLDGLQGLAQRLLLARRGHLGLELCEKPEVSPRSDAHSAALPSSCAHSSRQGASAHSCEAHLLSWAWSCA